MKLGLVDDYIPALIDGDLVRLLAEDLPQIMALPPHARLAGLIERWDALAAHIKASTRPCVPLDDVVLRAPLPRPAKLLCGQLSFKEGVAEAKVKPAFFLKSSTSVIGPGETVELPPVDAPVFHHEGELAVVIGKRAKSITPAEAMDHVFGYTCFLDMSARGVGHGTSFQDKSYDTFGPMGPWVLTADCVPDPHELQVRLWVDDELRQDYPMSDIGNPVADLVAYASSIAALEPGDVLALGVNHQGIGPIQDGDTVRIEIEPIGGFSVQVKDALGRRWEKGVDTRLAAVVLRMVRGEPLGTVDFSPRLDR
ncbi:fumarylacetoacetate hydrolase family protein [Sphingobium sp. Sx8-8]|uniref:fumarylacetoacetate hydrolase family protein n=1 Tax=Sphingobium sp. Sx8-8 TaxID=2933617 RepID=UPI001F55DE2B|nr:fumarylacetoacetate hydrolase family protein [Sphingobium sp. Sx8-8]